MLPDFYYQRLWPVPLWVESLFRFSYSNTFTKDCFSQKPLTLLMIGNGDLSVTISLLQPPFTSQQLALIQTVALFLL